MNEKTKSFAFCVALLCACSGNSPTKESTDGGAGDETDDGTASASGASLPELRYEGPWELDSEPRAPVVVPAAEGRNYVFVAHQFSSSVNVFEVNASGGFASLPALTLERAAAVAAGDFDGDDATELAVAVDSEPLLVVFDDLFGTPQGTEIALADSADSVVAADLDGDGDLDLALSISGSASEPATSVAVLVNDAGTFSEPTAIEIGFQPRKLTAADVDADGDQDLVVLLGTTAALVLANDGAGNLAVSAPFEVGEGVLEFALLDADGNGLLDLAAADLSAGTINLATDIPGGDAAKFFDLAAPFGIETARLNADGKLDLVVTSVDGASVVALVTDEEGKYARGKLVDVADAVRLGGLVANDFDGDGVDDLAVVEREREPNAGRLHVFLSGELPER